MSFGCLLNSAAYDFVMAADAINFSLPGWSRCFEIDSPGGTNELRLAQISDNSFKLLSSVKYNGVTGLENRVLDSSVLEDIRLVTPETLPVTDLVSVPSWFRWFTGTYGVYTPAALIHDRLISSNPDDVLSEISPQDADRYFRFMLKGLGLSLTKRWLMWTAVALRTRFYDGLLRRFSVVFWLALAFCGLGFAIAAVVSMNLEVLILSVLAPVVAASLWGRQYNAGIIASYIGIPWILLPAIFVGFFYGIYIIVERVFSVFDSSDNSC